MNQPSSSVSSNHQPLTPRERIGISIASSDASALLDLIVRAEEVGVEQLWMTQNPFSLDTLTMYAVAFERTSHIRLGTSIVPTYPRHPLALAQQAATVAALRPDRLRLGVGPSHRPVIESVYGIPMETPLAHLQEYVAILRGALWNGNVGQQGRFLTAKATMQRTTRVPILVSALGAEAFRVAGAISDGAISWNCPTAYLHDVARPALAEGAAKASRATPPLVAHHWVAMSTDRATVYAAARKSLTGYARLPFYVNMWKAAGYPLAEDGGVSDALLDALIIMGDDDAITTQLNDLLNTSSDELLLTLVPADNEEQERSRLFELVGTFG